MGRVEVDRDRRTLGGGLHRDLRPDPAAAPRHDDDPACQGIAAKVIVVEPTGAETELLLQVGDAQIIVVIHGRTAAKPDDTVYLAIDADKAHVFDSAGGKRLA